jgi:hypothetical protein
MIGFLVSAIGVQIASGVGLAALVAAIALGWFRARLFWLLAPTLAGTAAATWLFEDVSTAGKVVNAQSNFVFVLIVYLTICCIGYALGAVARRWR